MAKRPSLSGNITKPDAGKAADIARKITGDKGPPPAPPPDVEYETVSYNLPLDLIDLCRDLATERHRIDQAAKRELRRQIKAGKVSPDQRPQQARQSASAVVREALEAHRDAMQAELDRLRGQ